MVKNMPEIHSDREPNHSFIELLLELMVPVSVGIVIVIAILLWPEAIR